MIINVTGGPDLSLIEVSEASAIIQEAAHEDANIIFGAVVDPKLEGKVKITVIATGFDRAATRGRRPPRRRATPVDLHAYTDVPARPDAPASAARRRRRGRRSRAGRVLDLPLRPQPAAADPRTRSPVPTTRSPLDVPAFLRRQTRSSRRRRSTCRRSCGASEGSPSTRRRSDAPAVPRPAAPARSRW